MQEAQRRWQEEREYLAKAIGACEKTGRPVKGRFKNGRPIFGRETAEEFKARVEGSLHFVNLAGLTNGRC